MITEKRFASSCHSFWHRLLPMLEHFLRRRNRLLERFADPVESIGRPRVRGVINELGFRLYCRAVSTGTAIDALSDTAFAEETAAAIDFIRRFRGFSRGVARPDDQELEEATTLAERIGFVLGFDANALTLNPSFRGCGWVESCSGDVQEGRTLYEIKAGDRAFRGIDVRQVICYCALDWAATGGRIDEICLVNPRAGLILREALDDLCFAIGGAASAEILSDVVEFVSEPEHRYV